MRRHAMAHAGGDGSAVAPSRMALPIEGTGASILVTLAGAAGMIVSAFLEWIRPDGVIGANISYRAFTDPAFGMDASFFRSAGFVAILLGFVAIAGLTFRSGWITRLAGALGVIAFALFAITLYRAGAELPEALGVGMWVLAGSSLLALFGGFFNTRPKMIVRQEPEL
jgi:hypothetical protein